MTHVIVKGYISETHEAGSFVSILQMAEVKFLVEIQHLFIIGINS
jgi:hypothetical protein